MRWPISADCTGEPPGELIASATALAPRVSKARFEQRRHALDGKTATAQKTTRGDDPRQADDRNDGPATEAVL